LTQLLTLEQIHESMRDISRDRDVLNQGFDLATPWWRRELEKFGFEVQPPLGGGQESVRIDRRTLFGLASEVFNDERDPRDFAFHVLLWGSGPVDVTI
jgi:hypothetical protein